MLFNLQPMCFDCNNVEKNGRFPPTDIKKLCSNKCCRFIYIKVRSKWYLVYTHLLKYPYHRDLPNLKSMLFTFHLTEVQFTCSDGTKTPKMYFLPGKTNDGKVTLGYSPMNKTGGSISDLDIINNNKKYEKEELLESAKHLRHEIIRTVQKKSIKHSVLKNEDYKISEFEFGKLEDAMPDCDEIVRLNPKQPIVWLQGEYIKNNIGKFEEAIEDFTRTIELDKNSVTAYNQRGIAKGQLGRYEEAIEDFTRTIELDENCVTSYNDRGYSKYRLGKYEGAIEDFTRAIKLDKNFILAYNNRVFSKVELHLYQEAIDDLEKVIELKPDYAEAYNNRGIIKDKLGRHQEAIVDYDKAIELKPDLAEAYLGRGNVKGKLGRHQEAIVDYDKAIELKPDLAMLISIVGLIK